MDLEIVSASVPPSLGPGESVRQAAICTQETTSWLPHLLSSPLKPTPTPSIVTFVFEWPAHTLGMA